MDRKFIPLSVPNFPGNEVKYVSEAVASTWVSTAGPLIPKFETAVQLHCICHWLMQASALATKLSAQRSHLLLL